MTWGQTVNVTWAQGRVDLPWQPAEGRVVQHDEILMQGMQERCGWRWGTTGSCVVHAVVVLWTGTARIQPSDVGMEGHDRHVGMEGTVVMMEAGCCLIQNALGMWAVAVASHRTMLDLWLVLVCRLRMIRQVVLVHVHVHVLVHVVYLVLLTRVVLIVRVIVTHADSVVDVVRRMVIRC